MSAIDAVQEIVSRGDHSRAAVFYFYFARFEYALKRAGFVAASGEAQPDWEAFARNHSTLVTTETDRHFLEAVAYFKVSPPKKQIVTSSGLGWVDDNSTDPLGLSRLLVLVRRVRNNLFHGGKFQSGLAEEISRDTTLLDSSLAILEACLRADSTVFDYFLDGLFWR